VGTTSRSSPRKSASEWRGQGFAISSCPGRKDQNGVFRSPWIEPVVPEGTQQLLGQGFPLPRGG